MRIHEGDFAYDIEPQRNPATYLLSNWKFTVFKLRPFETILTSGFGKTREEAEKQARRAISRLEQDAGRAA